MEIPKHVYHVTTLHKFKRYLANGQINAPVRAWKTMEAADDFSKRTGRKIIIRLLTEGEPFVPYEGHKGNAVVLNYPFPIEKMEL